MSSKVCFLVCPIGADGSEVRKNSDLLLKYIIEPVATEKGYEVIRADRVLQTDVITDTIVNYLKNAELVIADLSVQNPNVYYELGFRTALNKPVIQIAAENSVLPFDISTRRTFFYDRNDLQKVDSFKSLLLEVIDNLEKQKATIDSSTQQFGQQLGMLFATGMAADMLNNPQKSSQYVGMLKDLAEIKQIVDEK